MTPSQTFLDIVADAIQDDTGGLAEAAFLLVTLIVAPFVPAAGLVVADLTVADFDGSDPLANTSATIQLFKDPQTGENILQVPEPAGGWHWQVTGGTSLPQTVYGYMLTDSTGAALLGTALLDTPVTLTATGQGLDIDQIRFRLSAQALS